MPTDLQELAARIRRDAEAAERRIAAERQRGEELAAQFTAAKRLPLSPEREEALANVAGALRAGANVPPPAEDNEEDPGQEEATFECAVCGERHSEDDAVAVIDHHGEEAIANQSCLEESYDWRQPEYQTRDQWRRGINWYHRDGLCYTDSMVATEDYAQDFWYYSERAGEWYETYEESPEYEEESEPEPIHDYHADVIDIHGWPDATPADALCFGVELEMECDSFSGRNELAERLGGRDGAAGRYILKSDGSLNCGIELVTAPFTLEHHQARFDWQGLTRKIGSDAKSFDTSTAGLHIHINRAALSPLTLGKLLVFVNDPANLQAIEGIAQRKANHWAQFHPKKITDAQYSDGDKYQSLNVRGRTVEMRIFKGNLNPRRILKNLEFAHAAVAYCSQASMRELTWQCFWDWLRKPANRKTYGNLIDFGHKLMRDELHTDTSEDI